MENIYGYRYSSVDSKNRTVVPRFMRDKITSEIGSVIIYNSIMRLYDIERLYKTIELVKEGSYTSSNAEMLKMQLSELYALFSNLRENVKLDVQGRILLSEDFACRAGKFDYVEGNRNVKFIGEGNSIALVPNQEILNKYEDGIYASTLLK